MKKIWKFTAVVVAIIMLAGMSAISASGSDDDTITVSLRIEGIEEAMYFNEEIELAAGASIADLMEKVRTFDDAPEVVMLDSDFGAYISVIGGLEQGDYGGWSGWSCRFNDVELTSGISVNFLSDGDVVVFYYGHTYDEPFMQYPDTDISRLFSDNIILFTSVATIYDDEGIPVMTENPVDGATVTFNGKVYTTDENGEITITDKTGISGLRALQVERYDEESGVPTVLRYAPNYMIFIPFADMLDSPWYESAVIFCVQRWSWTGTDLKANLFEPRLNMNMAQLVRVLALIADVDIPETSEPWYKTELDWALENEIITEDEFDATEYITKERFIHMFYLTIAVIGEADMTIREDITDAVDFDDISEEYLEAISWAVASGVLDGTSATELVVDPQQVFFRAMVCELLFKYFLHS